MCRSSAPAESPRICFSESLEPLKRLSALCGGLPLLVVATYRSDSPRIRELRERGIEVLILSSEPNTVVAARAKKMGVEAIHGVGLQDKGRVMREVLAKRNIAAEHVIYIGNDLNDLPCFEVAGWSVAVADAFPEVRRAADFILTKAGGQGALRELCDLILKNP